MDTTTAAATILAQFRKFGPNDATPACMFFTVHRSVRAAAFRRLSKLGLIEVAYMGGTGSTKNWRPTAKARALRDGEELSAVSK